MTQRRAVLSLGSNVGDRLAHLSAGVAALDAAEGVEVVAVSPVYETEPVGGPQQGDFANCVVLVATSLSPADLLAVAHAAEAARERVRDVRWGPRTLDVDVIDVEGEIAATPALTVPHPRAKERAFVLRPWLDVEPDAVLHGRAVREWLAECGSGPGGGRWRVLLPADGLQPQRGSDEHQ